MISKEITFVLGIFMGIVISWMVIFGILVYKALNTPDGTTVSIGCSLAITPKDSK